MVTFTDQVQLCICVDEEANPLMDAITWSDTRSLELENVIGKVISDADYYATTGTYNTLRSSLRKFMWVKEKMPEIYAKTYKMLGCKEFIIAKLTGEFLLEYSSAITTGIFEIENKVWYKKAVEACGIDMDKMPKAVECTTYGGELKADIASMFGLVPGIPVVIGAGDLTTSAVGAGAAKEGDAYMSVSSSSCIAVVSNKPILSDRALVENTIHAVPDLYVSYANLQEISATIKWLKNGVLHYEHSEERIVYPYKNYYPYDDMCTAIADTKIGANGVLFLPYLLGAGTNFHDKTPYSAYVGLDVDTTRGDMIRAGIEGIPLR